MNDGNYSEDWVNGYQLTLLDKSNVHASWARQKMENTIVEHNGKKIAGYEILEVYQVKNSDLWEKYWNRRDQIRREIGGRVKEARLFHGTKHAYKITEDGFNLNFANDRGMFGKGIYFADLSSKSNQYTFEGCNTPCAPHKKIFCTDCERFMLICRVALGKEYEPNAPMNGISAPPSGYHSILADPSRKLVNYREYAIYNNYQAYPGYLVKYKVKN
ncbi:Hypothetical predicted protein [Cloeon dipterum]|uniref:Poly [ADP-ribose] polymerase n=1 Tax=Cloeon dipterum TaxID=197152 RepID=A0A8S1BSJ4_9INSE|nr:Hypothetical predicted protein [Cloeon dipterum]